MKSHQQQELEDKSFNIGEPTGTYGTIEESTLTRGGFLIGEIPGLPNYIGLVNCATGRLKVTANAESSHRLPQTNLARTRLNNNLLVRKRVTQAWLTSLLDDIDNVEINRCGTYCIRGNGGQNDLETAIWLDSYTAYDLYRLARVMWCGYLGEDGEQRISNWEGGVGPSLPLGIFSDYVHRMLLEIVLPAICSLQTGNEAKPYVKPPSDGWIEKLKNWNTPISSPIRWGRFSEYISEIAGLLFFEYPGCQWLASQYEDKLRELDDSEHGLLTKGFAKLIQARGYGYRPTLTKNEANIVLRVGSLLPNAKIGSTRGAWPLSTFCKSIR
jgi:hypothetical protein